MPLWSTGSWPSPKLPGSSPQHVHGSGLLRCRRDPQQIVWSSDLEDHWRKRKDRVSRQLLQSVQQAQFERQLRLQRDPVRHHQLALRRVAERIGLTHHRAPGALQLLTRVFTRGVRFATPAGLLTTPGSCQLRTRTKSRLTASLFFALSYATCRKNSVHSETQRVYNLANLGG